MQLFKSGVGRTVLTEVGERFLVHIRTTLASVNAEVSVITRQTLLRVAVHGTQIADANLMQFYLDRHPAVRIELLMSSPTRTSRTAVLWGRVDACFARRRLACPTAVSLDSFDAHYTDELRLPGSGRHRQAAHCSVRPSVLAADTARVPGARFESEVGDFYQRLSNKFSIVIDTDRLIWHSDIDSVPIINPRPRI